VSDARRFARFGATGSFGVEALPDDGMCLSVYLVLQRPDRRGEVVLGRIDPNGPWENVAAIDRQRLARIADRWVLPATQLLLFESPQEAAQRISAETLGRRDLRFGAPQLFSEAYRREGPHHDPHWDLHLVYVADWTGAAPEGACGPLWKDLRFVDVVATPAVAFGRGHGDVLALVGLPPRAA
jgi:hypothetical protein